MKYSKLTGGFYDEAINSVIPDDAVEITDAEHAALLDGQSLGQRIVSDKGGNPVLASPAAPTAAQLAAQARIDRNALLDTTDKMVLPDYPLAAAKLTAVKTYRQALRDLPAQTGFPQTVNWPVKP